jgi:hypothetical protein
MENKKWTPIDGELVLLASPPSFPGTPHVTIREYNPNNGDDKTWLSQGEIFPDTADGMKAARKFAGLDSRHYVEDLIEELEKEISDKRIIEIKGHKVKGNSLIIPTVGIDIVDITIKVIKEAEH